MHLLSALCSLARSSPPRTPLLARMPTPTTYEGSRETSKTAVATSLPARTCGDGTDAQDARKSAKALRIAHLSGQLTFALCTELPPPATNKGRRANYHAINVTNLLAYMDGELERLYPQEAQEIGKKIEGSKFATDLFHKIRDVMRRLRLAAPSITEKGTNLDCNTVAEYLDNELPDERVPDFEEVCLKSDMHLAEVASCHQILAIAQVELFEIEPEAASECINCPRSPRVDDERQAAVDAASALSGDGHAQAPPPAAAKVRPRPVVPEYLREPPGKRRLLSAVAITLLLGALLALILILLGLTNRGTPIGNFLAWAEEKISGRHEERNESGNQPKQPAGEAAKTSGSARPRRYRC